MRSIDEIAEIFACVRYVRPGRLDWRIRLNWHLDTIYLQVVEHAADGSDTWTGRKWLISRHMTPSELVATAFKAILTAEEHEAREFFTYKGVAVYGPHIDVEALAGVAEQLDVRPEPAV